MAHDSTITNTTTAPEKGNTLKEKGCFLFRPTGGQEKETREKETKGNTADVFPFPGTAEADEIPLDQRKRASGDPMLPGLA